MIVDTSAVMAIVRGEGDAERFAVAMKHTPVLRMSAGSWLELGVVTMRTGDEEIVAFADHVVSTFRIVIEPVTIAQAEIARRAFREFGRTRHAAALNYGDCFAYALSKALDEPLLFKGDDFRKTDVVRWDD